MDDVSEVVRTRRLEICNSQGAAVLTADCWSDGTPVVRFYDNQGLERMVLSLGEGFHPKISLLDRDGKTLVGIGVTETACGLNIFNSAGSAIIFAGVDATGKPVLQAVEGEA